MIKQIYLSILFLAFAGSACGQIGKTRNLGASSDFTALINKITVSSSNARHSGSTFMLTTPSGEKITGNVNLKKSLNGKQTIIGSTGSDGSFDMAASQGGDISGLYTSVKNKTAYRYYTDEATGNVMVKEVDIATVLCIDYRKAPGSLDNPLQDKNNRLSGAPIPKFESKPGSQYVIYIDLDGEVSTSRWNSGNTINAAARTWTNADVQTMWEVVAQDYLAWDVNVTTDRAVFDAAAPCRRKMCIVTSTSTAAPGSGGVAYINSFDNCSDDPCWAFNAGAKVAGETISHEIGHTLGLKHDGTPSSAYYSGHNNWAPIMGSAYGTNTVGHWSLGEYTNANNQEDDIQKIGTQNGFGAKPDDIGNTMATAKMLAIEANGSVLNTLNRGLINNRTDIDLFKFTTVSVGNLNLSINPFYKNPDLNVKARLLNSSGTAIVTADPAGTTYTSMSATVTANSLAAGTYYLEIDGVGNGADPMVGYSDYSSIGDYYISGMAPLPSNNPVPQFSASISELCQGTQVTFTDQSLNSASSWKWTFAGGTPATSYAPNPSITYNSPGTYNVKLLVQNANGKDSITKTNYIVVKGAPNSPVATGASRCNPGVVNLSASGNGGNLQWYTTSIGGTPVNTGSTFSPNLSTSTTYYVSEAGVSASQYVGPADNTLNTGAYYTTSDARGLFFDVIGICTLKSVKVYANTAGNRTIEVRQGVGGAVLFTKTVNIPAGESRVTLDFNLQPGSQYFIKVTGALVDLYRNSAGASYPYTLANLITITESDAAPANPNYYYYFYDWEITAAGCTSTRTAVTGTINATPPTPTINTDGNVLTSSAATSYQWYKDGSLIPGATAQSYTVTNQGSYFVEIINASGCKAISAATVITEINQIAKSKNMRIYPNPANYYVIFEGISINSQIELYDVLGKKMLSQFKHETDPKIKVSEFMPGIYFFKIISDDNSIQTGKFIKE